MLEVVEAVVIPVLPVQGALAAEEMVALVAGLTIIPVLLLLLIQVVEGVAVEMTPMAVQAAPVLSSFATQTLMRLLLPQQALQLLPHQVAIVSIGGRVLARSHSEVKYGNNR